MTVQTIYLIVLSPYNELKSIHEFGTNSMICQFIQFQKIHISKQ
jgi:hypothetical protein